MIRLTAAGFAATIFIASTPGAHANQSVYTRIEWETGCTTVEQSKPDESGSRARLECKGYKALPIRVHEDDARMSVSFGHAGRRTGRESFASFNTVGDVVEWRLRNTRDGARPFATILRWSVSTLDTGRSRQVLVVSTVADGRNATSCVAGYVDANANAHANRLARQIADTVAARFECGRDTPVFHNTTTARTPQPARFGSTGTANPD